jgi:hypothetical protein
MVQAAPVRPVFRGVGEDGRNALCATCGNAALIGAPTAAQLLAYDGHSGRIYIRADTKRVVTVSDLLAPTANPESPGEVAVSRPSDALAARVAVAGSSTALFLGLGAVALLVGAIGIANLMVISVLERRSKIGLRRALGATRRHVAVQLLAECSSSPPSAEHSASSPASASPSDSPKYAPGPSPDRHDGSAAEGRQTIRGNVLLAHAAG